MNAFFDEADFYDWLDDLSKIQSVNGLLKLIAEFIRGTKSATRIGEEVDFNTDNLFEWYDIESLSDLDEDLCAAYDDDVAMDRKIETIDNIIRLVLSDDIDEESDNEDIDDDEESDNEDIDDDEEFADDEDEGEEFANDEDEGEE